MKFSILTLFIFNFLYASFELSTGNIFLDGTASDQLSADQLNPIFLINPATTANNKNIILGIRYFRPYGIQELNCASLISSFRLRNYGFGLSYFTFGDKLYRENKITFNSSHSVIKETLFAGVNINWYTLSIHTYGNASSFGLDVGLSYVISSKLVSGLSINNINQPTINGYDDEIPVITNWGISFLIDEHIYTYLMLQKDTRFPLNIQFGVNYQANSIISLLSGINTYPAVPAIGFKLRQKQISFHYLFQYHFDLGGTHFWGASFMRKGK